MYTMLAEEPEEYSKEKILKTSEESQNNPDTALVAGASGKGKGKCLSLLQSIQEQITK